MLNVARQEGWLVRNPFDNGEALISAANEARRQRIVSTEEERRLLDECSRSGRDVLRAIIVMAIDTGMRKGEIFKVRWTDVDLFTGRITVIARNTKTERARELKATTRLLRELVQLAAVKSSADALVFCRKDNVKRSFTAVRSAAGLRDVRFHDLRHTAATRLVQGGLALPEVGRILGHTQPQTTYRYINIDAHTQERAANILDAFTAAWESRIPASAEVKAN
jgi:integrase